jgi:hypothetical protein
LANLAEASTKIKIKIGPTMMAEESYKFPSNKLLEYFVSQKFHVNKKKSNSVNTKKL